MNLLQVFLLAGIALVVSRLKNHRGLVLLGVNLALIFFLQPHQEPVNLVFWLPLIALIIAIGSWVLTSSETGRRWEVIRQPIFIICIVVIVIDLTRYLGEYTVLFTGYPRLQWVLFALCSSGVGLVLLARRRVIPSAWLIVAIGCIVALLIMLKIPAAIFFGLNQIAELRGKNTGHISPVTWLGYSYLSFRLIHTLLDRIAGRLPQVKLVDYLNYIFFFPAYASGPIDRIERFVSNLNDPDRDARNNLIQGGRRLFLGLIKKFLIADSLAWITINEYLIVDSRSATWVWIFLWAYSFRIFFDFSGYTDIAIGFARIMGIRLPENFDAPYSKPNVTLFWNSWHMSLTQWFRSYLFNPLTRKLRSFRRIPSALIVLISQCVTMVLIGLWHGISLNYLLWGLWHGVGLFIHNRWSNWFRPQSAEALTIPTRPAISKYVGAFATFNFVSVGWLFFIFPQPADIWKALLRLAGV